MIRKRGESGIIILTAVFFLIFTVIASDYFILSMDNTHIKAADEYSELTIRAGESQGTIYDRKMRPLVNENSEYYAVIVPYAADMKAVEEYAYDEKELEKHRSSTVPYVIKCRKEMPSSEGITVFEIPERYSEDNTAQHIIGYLSEGKGASGIEYAYDKILRNESGENSVTYTCDGFGRVLIGDGKKVRESSCNVGGVVTTIDRDHQKICENAVKDPAKGAIVLSDVYSGDILSLVSFPEYSPDRIEEAIADPESPLINRALYSYSVGSVFKLVTACEAINEGKKGYIYECSGSIGIKGQRFNCHKYDGHGKENLTKALTDSCNTYFIALSRRLDKGSFRRLAHDLSFGRETPLCAGIVGSSGVLPSLNDLDIPAELANFSFGQGKLSATPLQVNQMTCAIANGGQVPVLRLIKGITVDGKNTANEKPPQLSAVISSDTSAGLRRMMTAAIRDNENANAYSPIVKIAAKTSTAQTGRYDDEGNEYCHGWITGFFPADSPKYALTVLIEDGGYGNDAAAPLFREIAEKISLLERKTDENATVSEKNGP